MSDHATIRLSTAEVETALRAALPPELHAGVPALARWLARPSEDLPAELAPLLRALAGQSVSVRGALVSFGESSQVGDVTIRDVVGGQSTTLSVRLGPRASVDPPEREARAGLAEAVRRACEVYLAAAYAGPAPGGATPEGPQLRLPAAVSVAARDRLAPTPGAAALDSFPPGLLNPSAGEARVTVVTGAPGAGKSVWLRRLCVQILDRSRPEAGDPAPVVLSLAAWGDEEVGFADWLAAQLRQGYGVGAPMARRLARGGELILLLDDVDLLPRRRLEPLNQQLASYLAGAEALVLLASRSADARLELPEQLVGARCVVGPLGAEQVSQAVRAAGDERLADALARSPGLRAAAADPLLLQLAAAAARSGRIERVRATDPEALRGWLVGDYTDRALASLGDYRDLGPAAPLLARLAGRAKELTSDASWGRAVEFFGRALARQDGPPDPERAGRWAAWLAVQMRERGTPGFEPGLLQSDWLAPGERRPFARADALLNGGLWAAVALLVASSVPASIAIGRVSNSTAPDALAEQVFGEAIRLAGITLQGTPFAVWVAGVVVSLLIGAIGWALRAWEYARYRQIPLHPPPVRDSWRLEALWWLAPLVGLLTGIAGAVEFGPIGLAMAPLVALATLVWALDIELLLVGRRLHRLIRRQTGLGDWLPSVMRWLLLVLGALVLLVLVPSGLVVALPFPPSQTASRAEFLSMLSFVSVGYGALGLLIFLFLGGPALLRNWLLLRAVYAAGHAPRHYGAFLEALCAAGVMRRAGDLYRFRFEALAEELAERAYTAELARSVSAWEYLARGAAQAQRRVSPAAVAARGLTLSVQPRGSVSGASQDLAISREQLSVAAKAHPPDWARLDAIARLLNNQVYPVGLATGCLRSDPALTPAVYLAALSAAATDGLPSVRVEAPSLPKLRFEELEVLLSALAATLRLLRPGAREDTNVVRLISLAAWLEPKSVIRPGLPRGLLAAMLRLGDPECGEAEAAAALARCEALGLLLQSRNARLIGEQIELDAGLAALVRALTAWQGVDELVELNLLRLLEEPGRSALVTTPVLEAVADHARERGRATAVGLLLALARHKVVVPLAGSPEQGIATAEAAAELARRGGDGPLGFTADLELGLLLIEAGEYERAGQLLEQLVARWSPGLAGGAERVRLLLNAGLLRRQRGDLAGARAHLEAGLAVSEEAHGAGHPKTAELVLLLGVVHRLEHDYPRAAALTARALAIYEGLPEQTLPLAAALVSQAHIAQDQGRYGAAAADLGRARALYESLGAGLRGAWAAAYAGLLTLEAREGPVGPAFAEALAGLERVGLGRLAQQLRPICDDLVAAAGATSRLTRSAALGRATAALAELSGQALAATVPARLRIQVDPLLDRFRTVVSREAGRTGQIIIGQPVPSPYLYTRPVSGQRLVGRDAVFGQIRAQWAGGPDRDSLLICGHRRMGKTSIAQALAAQTGLDETTRAIYLSLERAELGDEGALYYTLAAELHGRLRLGLAEPRRADFAPGEARVALNRLLGRVDELLAGRTVILILDELELLFQRLGPAVARDAIANLRGQTQTFPWLTLVLVGLNDLEDLSRRYDVAIHGWTVIRVDFLGRASVRELLANPAGDDDFPLEYDGAALDLIADLTSGQPYLVQVVGSLLVQRYNQQVFVQELPRSPRLTTGDVQAVVEDARFYEAARAYFAGVWSQVVGGLAGETAALVALAPHPAGLDEPAIALATGLGEAELGRALEALERHLIVERRAGGRHAFKVELMRRWVLETNPLLSPSLSE